MATTVIVSFKAKDGKREAVIDFLKGVQPGAIKAGCKSIAVHRELSTADRVLEVEYWNSKTDHEAFVKAAADAGAFKPLEDLLAAPFEVSYCEPVQKTDA